MFLDNEPLVIIPYLNRKIIYQFSVFRIKNWLCIEQKINLRKFILSKSIKFDSLNLRSNSNLVYPLPSWIYIRAPVYQALKSNKYISDEERTYTLDDAVESLGFGWFNALLILLTGMATVSDTIELMLVAQLSPELKCEWDLSQIEVSR